MARPLRGSTVGSIKIELWPQRALTGLLFFLSLTELAPHKHKLALGGLRLDANSGEKRRPDGVIHASFANNVTPPGPYLQTKRAAAQKQRLSIMLELSGEN